MLVKIIEKFSN